MKRLFILVLAMTWVLRAAAYDVAADFSLANNPSGTWSYGYTPTLGGSFNLLTLATNNFGGVTGWNQWSTAANTDPGVYKNNGSVAVTNDGALVPPGTFVLRPGAGTELSAARWTAPSEGYWRITGTFTGVQATTTDVHIRAGAAALFDDALSGLGDTKSFNVTLNTLTTDTLDFLAGNGGNGDAHDLTGLTVTIANAAVLTIEKQGGNVILRWPTAAADFQLEFNPSVTAPGDWMLVPEFPSVEGSFWKVIHPIVPAGEFFRLHYHHAEET